MLLSPIQAPSRGRHYLSKDYIEKYVSALLLGHPRISQRHFTLR